MGAAGGRGGRAAAGLGVNQQSPASGKQRLRSERASDKRPLSLAALTTTPLTPTPKLGTGWGEGMASWRQRLLTVGRQGKGAQCHLPTVSLLDPRRPKFSREHEG